MCKTLWGLLEGERLVHRDTKGSMEKKQFILHRWIFALYRYYLQFIKEIDTIQSYSRPWSYHQCPAEDTEADGCEVTTQSHSLLNNLFPTVVQARRTQYVYRGTDKVITNGDVCRINRRNQERKKKHVYLLPVQINIWWCTEQDKKSEEKIH